MHALHPLASRYTPLDTPPQTNRSALSRTTRTPHRTPHHTHRLPSAKQFVPIVNSIENMNKDKLFDFLVKAVMLLAATAVAFVVVGGVGLGEGVSSVVVVVVLVVGVVVVTSSLLSSPSSSSLLSSPSLSSS